MDAARPMHTVLTSGRMWRIVSKTAMPEQQQQQQHQRSTQAHNSEQQIMALRPSITPPTEEGGVQSSATEPRAPLTMLMWPKLHHPAALSWPYAVVLPAAHGQARAVPAYCFWLPQGCRCTVCCIFPPLLHFHCWWWWCPSLPPTRAGPTCSDAASWAVDVHGDVLLLVH